MIKLRLWDIPYYLSSRISFARPPAVLPAQVDYLDRYFIVHNEILRHMILHPSNKYE